MQLKWTGPANIGGNLTLFRYNHSELNKHILDNVDTYGIHVGVGIVRSIHY